MTGEETKLNGSNLLPLESDQQRPQQHGAETSQPCHVLLSGFDTESLKHNKVVVVLIHRVWDDFSLRAMKISQHAYVCVCDTLLLTQKKKKISKVYSHQMSS